MIFSLIVLWCIILIHTYIGYDFLKKFIFTSQTIKKNVIRFVLHLILLVFVDVGLLKLLMVLRAHSHHLPFLLLTALLKYFFQLFLLFYFQHYINTYSRVPNSEEFLIRVSSDECSWKNIYLAKIVLQ